MSSSAAPNSGDRTTRRSPAPRLHVVLLPSAGMGHLVPFTRLAVALCSGHHDACDVSLVTAMPTVSSAESRHLVALFAAFPAVRRLDLRLAPLDLDAPELAGADPFYLRYEAMRRSASLLPPLLAGGASAVVVDIALASVVIPVVKELRIPCYVFFTASATMLAFLAYLPTYLDATAGATGGGHAIGDVDVPGVCRVPRSSVPQALHDPDDIFTRQFIANGRSLAGADGLIVNAFDAFEPDAVDALRRGTVAAGLPPVFAVGPLTWERFPARDSGDYVLPWLDAQPARSVVYVSFGSRKTLPRHQLTSVAAGLESSGHRFLWVVKSTIVDRDDAGEIADLLGKTFLDRIHGRRGHVTTAWVRQEEILSHPAVGLFVSHCGWNSVTEAAASGVPVLAWPRFADQRVNAAVVARAGIGAWEEERWSWEGEDGVVSAEEIAGMVKSVMGDGEVRKTAARVREAAATAVADGGTSYRSLVEFVHRCRNGSVTSETW